jgi:hypothetical protein
MATDIPATPISQEGGQISWQAQQVAPGTGAGGSSTIIAASSPLQRRSRLSYPD